MRKWLKKLREESGLSQQQVADSKLGEYFNISVDDLLNEDMSDRDENLVILNRNAKKLSPEKRKQLLEMAKLIVAAAKVFNNFCH